MVVGVPLLQEGGGCRLVLLLELRADGRPPALRLLRRRGRRGLLLSLAPCESGCLLVAQEDRMLHQVAGGESRKKGCGRSKKTFNYQDIVLEQLKNFIW